jgi:hypothetical protein
VLSYLACTQQVCPGCARKCLCPASMNCCQRHSTCADCFCAGSPIRPQSMYDTKTTLSQAVGCLSYVHCTYTSERGVELKTARAFWQLRVVADCNAQGCVLCCQHVLLHCAYIHEAFHTASCLMRVWVGVCLACCLIVGIIACCRTLLCQRLLRRLGVKPSSNLCESLPWQCDARLVAGCLHGFLRAFAERC